MAHENKTFDAMMTHSGDRIYPADYTLQQWLNLRRGWDKKIDAANWHRAQHSALGPNPNVVPDGAYRDKFGDVRWVGTGELYKRRQHSINQV